MVAVALMEAVVLMEDRQEVGPNLSHQAGLHQVHWVNFC